MRWPSVGTASWAEVDAPVGGVDHIDLVLDDDHRAAALGQAGEDADEAAEIVWVQPGGGFVEQHEIACLGFRDLAR